MLTEKDIQTLEFIYNRLVAVHGENIHYDYMLNLRSTINRIQTEVAQQAIQLLKD